MKHITLKLCLLLSLIAFYLEANADTEIVVDNLRYSVDTASGTATVTDLDDRNVSSVVIPEYVEYDGMQYPVTSIGGSAFYGCSGLTSVTIPNSVTSIGWYAFMGCSGMNSVTIGNSVTSIGGYAFSGCSGMNSVTIGNSVTSIGGYAFYGCSGLTSVTIGNSVTSIGEYAFYGCSGLTSMSIPASVIEIGNCVFNDCMSLKDLTIEDGTVTLSLGYNYHSISNYAEGQGLFYDCPLETLYLGRDLSYDTSSNYGYSPFWKPGWEPSNLENITIGNSVTSIDSNHFINCHNIKTLSLDCENILGWFKGHSSIKTITLGDNVKEIAPSAFSGCYRLEKASFASVENLCNINFGSKSSNPLYFTHKFINVPLKSKRVL